MFNLSAMLCSPLYFRWPLGFLFLSLCCPLAFSAGLKPLDEENVFADFQQWVRCYLQADEEKKARLVAEGERLAESRRPRFRKMMEEKPAKAANVAICPDHWKKLPSSVAKNLEAPFSGTGILRLLVIDDFERGIARYEHHLRFENQTYKVFLAVPQAEVAINQRMFFKGFFLGRAALVVHATPEK